MKAIDIVQQLIKTLPFNTSSFNSEATITAVSRSSTTVTVTTSVAQSLTVGEDVILINIGSIIPVASTTAVDSVITATTSIPHDITDGFTTTVIMLDATEAIYNGQFNLISSVNRNDFVYDIGTIPAGSPGVDYKLIEYRDKNYNGIQTVTAVTATTFDYEIPATVQGDPTLLAAATRVPSLQYDFRVTRAITIERFINSYEKQLLPGDFWLCVVTNITNSSRDRNITSDATFVSTGSGFGREKIIQTFDVFCLVKAVGRTNEPDDVLAGAVKDSMDDVMLAIFKSILSFKPTSNFDSGQQYGIVFLNHDIEFYNGATYGHRFSFELQNDITDNDTANVIDTRAFRDVDIIQQNIDNDEILRTLRVNLDEEPNI